MIFDSLVSPHQEVHSFTRVRFRTLNLSQRSQPVAVPPANPLKQHPFFQAHPNLFLPIRCLHPPPTEISQASFSDWLLHFFCGLNAVFSWAPLSISLGPAPVSAMIPVVAQCWFQIHLSGYCPIEPTVPLIWALGGIYWTQSHQFLRTWHQ